MITDVLSFIITVILFTVAIAGFIVWLVIRKKPKRIKKKKIIKKIKVKAINSDNEYTVEEVIK